MVWVANEVMIIPDDKEIKNLWISTLPIGNPEGC